MELRKNIAQAVARVKNEGFRGLAHSIWQAMIRHPRVWPQLCGLVGEVGAHKMWMSVRVGYWPHLRTPRSLNEKIVHRKLFTDRSIFAEITDKESVRRFVESKVGDDILADVYQICNNAEKLEFEPLPTEFVIKQGNKGVRLVDKTKDDLDAIRAECRDVLQEAYGIEKGEYWYSDAKQQLIVEEKLSGLDYGVPVDYKFFVFHGEVVFVQVNVNRFGDHEQSLYDAEWNYLDIWYNQPKGGPIKKPELFDEMVATAEQLGEDFEFMRVDLYQTKSGVKFGELTPAPTSGVGGFRPKQYDFEFGTKW